MNRFSKATTVFFLLTLLLLLSCSFAMAEENNSEAENKTAPEVENSSKQAEENLSSENPDESEKTLGDQNEPETTSDVLNAEDDPEKQNASEYTSENANTIEQNADSKEEVQAIDLSRAGNRGISWDLELEGGVVAYGDPGVRYRGMGRIRAGVLLIDEPHYLSLGAAFEGWGQVEAFTLETVYSHILSGLWAEAGLGVTLEKEFTLHVSAGWSVVGVEFQKNFGDGPRDNLAVITKIRIPIGILVFGLTN